MSIIWTQLVTLKYTQYGGEGYLRDGVKGFFVRENSFTNFERRPGQAAFLFVPDFSSLELISGSSWLARLSGLMFVTDGGVNMTVTKEETVAPR